MKFFFLIHLLLFVFNFHVQSSEKSTNWYKIDFTFEGETFPVGYYKSLSKDNKNFSHLKYVAPEGDVMNIYEEVISGKTKNGKLIAEEKKVFSNSTLISTTKLLLKGNEYTFEISELGQKAKTITIPLPMKVYSSLGSYLDKNEVKIGEEFSVSQINTSSELEGKPKLQTKYKFIGNELITIKGIKRELRKFLTKRDEEQHYSYLDKNNKEIKTVFKSPDVTLTITLTDEKSALAHFPSHLFEDQNKSITPNDALKKYFLSLKIGDKELYKSTIHGSQKYIDGMSATVDMSKALFDFQNAIKEKYKNDKAYSQLIASFGNVDDIDRRSKNIEIKINGNTAVSIPKSKEEVPVSFVKIDGSWKLDFSQAQTELANLQVNALNKAIPKIILKINESIKLVKETSTSPMEIARTLQGTIVQLIEAEGKKLEGQGK